MECTMIIGIVVLLLEVVVTGASQGDQSWVFLKCMDHCHYKNCTKPGRFLAKQPVHLQLLGWDCLEECKYVCMWETVDAFHKDGTPVPQFFGKWPFIRIAGIQEPASVIFSILNGLAHVVMITKLRKHVPSSAPMYTAHHIYAMICINAWIWSTIFHTRDFPLTENMDYFCATSLVLINAYILCLRIIGTEKLWRALMCGAIFISCFVYHVHYLAFVRFDYGYNMQVNITVGVLNALGWVAWWYHYRQLPHTWKSAGTMLLLNVLICLELGDFPPLIWVLDAHALWHAGTAPVTLLWYSFVIDDCLYLNRKSVRLQETVNITYAESGLPKQHNIKKER